MSLYMIITLSILGYVLATLIVTYVYTFIMMYQQGSVNKNRQMFIIIAWAVFFPVVGIKEGFEYLFLTLPEDLSKKIMKMRQEKVKAKKVVVKKALNKVVGK